MTTTKVNLANTVEGTLPVANGGTGSTTTAGAANAILPSQTGNTGKYLTTNGTDTSWGTVTSNPGTVTSVGGTGTVNGITLSGTVTSSGNLTLGGALSGVSLTTQVTGTLPVANGGTGTTTPSLVGGTNITISGTWPNQTVTAAGGGVTSLNGQTGAITNTGSNAIGSYVASISRFGGLGIFSTVAGSSLLYYNEPSDSSVSMGLSGTWRYMGNTLASGGSNNPNVPSLYVRIS